jgi:SAM-dependent methyltransferase
VATAAERWKSDLESWAIPQEILDAAPESPWGFSVELFARRADASVEHVTPSTAHALEALPEGGTVIDVGCGAGAASLPLAGRAGRLVGVDSSPEMLDAFRGRAEATGCDVDTVEGAWPEAADHTPIGDVVLCHHVFYNAPELPLFAQALTDHARRRVVAELTAKHPRSTRNPLWLQFHGLVRPERPTAADAEAVLREMGLDPDHQQWDNPIRSGFGRLEDLVASVRKELCLSADRDPEIREAVRGWAVERDGMFGFPPQPLVTLWWGGEAPISPVNNLAGTYEEDS